jgi:hypothetical protein
MIPNKTTLQKARPQGTLNGCLKHPLSKHIAKAVNKLILMKEKFGRHRIDMANIL